MSFSYQNARDEEFAHSVLPLIRLNNGFFKSKAQADYFRNVCTSMISVEEIPEYMKHRGITYTLAEGDFVDTVSYYNRWADYGTRSVRPGEYFFIFDDHGVKIQYKLSCYGVETGGGFKKEKTQIVWERSADAKIPEFVTLIDTRVNEYIGTVGDKKVEISGKIVKISFVAGESAFYRTMTQFITIEDSDGRTIVWKSSKSIDVAENQNISIIGNIVDHREYKGRKQTMMNRCKIK
jgi:hypothetical protein